MNVKIIRVLNTNAVVSVDSQGMELIMTGPGIGLKKRKGENIDQSLVDKTYHLENKEESKRLQEVVKEISEEYLGIVDRVVKEAKKEKLEIRDSLYVTLTDHINSTTRDSTAVTSPASSSGGSSATIPSTPPDTHPS